MARIAHHQRIGDLGLNLPLAKAKSANCAVQTAWPGKPCTP